MQRRFTLTLSTVFGLLATLLAGVGIYGVTVYVTGQRRPEIGLRMALGATRSEVLSGALGQAMRLSLLGIVLGLVASLVLSNLLRSQLYEVTAADPWTYLAVSLLAAVLCLLATALPAYRASRTDPLQVLRYE